MITTLLVWRFLKWTALLMLAAGTTGAFLPEHLPTRQRMVYHLGTAGLALTWLSGFGLLRALGHSMKAPWISGSILLSIAWFYVLVWSVEREERRQPRWAAVAVALLLAALALMVFRPGGTP